MNEYTPEQIAEIRNALPAGFLEQVVRAEMVKRTPPPRPDRPRSQPATGRYAAVANGTHRRASRPRAAADDRAYVPGALKHWRRVHGLSQRQAQERIGYSAGSCSWGNWESGHVAPPYRVLLMIILTTGLGHWVDPDHSASMEPDLRLEMARSR